MTGILHGELDASGTRILLWMDANPWEAQQIGQRLSMLTPLLEPAMLNGRPAPGAPLWCPTTWPAVVQIGHAFGGVPYLRWAPGPKLSAWMAAEVLRRTSPPPPLTATFPPGKVLRDYQEQGAALMAAEGRFLLNDDPGTGKSCEIIAALEQRRVDGIEVFPMVIAVPSWSVGEHWRREIKAWAPGWVIPRLHGGPNRVRAITARTRRQYERDTFIVTYATLRLDANDDRGPLTRLQPATVVLDEAQAIKSAKLVTANGNSTVSAAARRVARHAGTVIAATGTPVEQDIMDIYPMLDAIDPASFPAGLRFRQRYAATVPNGYAEKVTGLNPYTEPEFRAVMLGRMRRVAKGDPGILDQLPPKIYSVRYVQIPQPWRAAYDEMESDMLAQLPDGQVLPAFEVMTKVGHLSQMASAAFDVEVTEEIDEQTGETVKHYHVVLKTPCWKADELLEIMAERPGRAVACFAPSKQLVLLAGQAAEKTGYRVGYVTGTGGDITQASRQRDIDAFQAGQLDLICVTTGAGGTGITLTAAGTAVFLRRSWRLGESLQAEDRVHRWGSERWEHGVEIIDVIAEDTVESGRLRERLREKAGQLAELVQDSRIVEQMFGGIK